MTDEPVIRWLEDYGGTVHRRALKAPRKPLFVWRLLRQMDVSAWLSSVLPFLIVKREQADLVLDAIAARSRCLVTNARRGQRNAAATRRAKRNNLELPL